MSTRQTITLSGPNNSWLAAQTESGEYSSKSEAINDLIRRARRNEGELAAIRAGLLQAEESIARYGYSKKSVSQIWEEAKEQHKADDGNI
ncbi:ribbon-helix-helix domain-containing protein [Porticoccus sp. GXU_MW_L64]